MRNIEVFYRTCYSSPNQGLVNRNRPEWFSKENCWRRLLPSYGDGERVNIIYDKHFEPDDNVYSGLTQPWFSYAQSDMRRGFIDIIDAGTEAESFLKTLDIIMERKLPDDTIVYIVEDDYLHLDSWPTVLREAFDIKGVDYVTLYDHADKYQYYPDLKSTVYATKSCHWRTTPSTCNTYAMLMGRLREDIDTHKFFSRNHNGGVSRDHDKFVELGRLGRTLVSSIPGFATHCQEGLISPAIRWDML